MNYSIFRLIKLKTTKDICSVANHNNRSNAYYPSNADKKRASDNELIKGTGNSLKEFQKLTEGQKIRANAVLGYDIVLTTSKAFDNESDSSRWKKQSVAWLETTFGKENVCSVWLHEDESAPHLHAFVVPIDDKGKLNASYFTGDSKAMTNLQTSYNESLSNLKLDRGIKHSKAQHMNKKEYLNRQRAIEERLKKMNPKELKDELIKTLIRLDQLTQSEKDISSSLEKSIAKNDDLMAKNSDLTKKVAYYKKKLDIIKGFPEGEKALNSISIAEKLYKQLNQTFEFKYAFKLLKYKPTGNIVLDVRKFRDNQFMKDIVVISTKQNLRSFGLNNTFYQNPFKNSNLKLSSIFCSALASLSDSSNCVIKKDDFKSALKLKGLSDEEIEKIMNSKSSDKEKE